MTQLHRYLSRLQDTILSRQEITIEFLEIFDRSNFANRKSRYVYHYQSDTNQLIFRYDNAPHHPEITTHPHHKHENNQIIASTPPDLSDVLREIDDYLYSQQRGNS